MAFSESDLAFLATNHGAAMTTLRADGTPHSVRVGVALVDGKLWSSGVPERIRTRHLRRDPRATVMVFESGFGYLTIESTVTILEGPDAPAQSYRLFDVMQAGRQDPELLMWYGKPLRQPEFEQAMRDEHRLIYEFTPVRSYGMPGS
jgi:PPOX class probable F420-dependent enzyme